MWIVLLALAAMSPKEQLRMFDEIEHPVTAGLIVHVIPVPVGSGSESVTLLAMPSPPLVTTIVKPIGSSALTDAASGVFETLSPGVRIVKHSTVVSVCSPCE